MLISIVICEFLWIWVAISQFSILNHTLPWGGMKYYSQGGGVLIWFGFVNHNSGEIPLCDWIHYSSIVWQTVNGDLHWKLGCETWIWAGEKATQFSLLLEALCSKLTIMCSLQPSLAVSRSPINFVFSLDYCINWKECVLIELVTMYRRHKMCVLQWWQDEARNRLDGLQGVQGCR